MVGSFNWMIVGTVRFKEKVSCELFDSKINRKNIGKFKDEKCMERWNRKEMVGWTVLGTFPSFF